MEQTQAQTKVENNHARFSGTDVVGALFSYNWAINDFGQSHPQNNLRSQGIITYHAVGAVRWITNMSFIRTTRKMMLQQSFRPPLGQSDRRNWSINMAMERSSTRMLVMA
mmetsp:Transcript_10484/g.19117  ORF Transcript_10484/g.19117 Transcript_10484/m.19117 type:complete len:110 (+) Transcript_10484:690-1019(+)